MWRTRLCWLLAVVTLGAATVNFSGANAHGSGSSAEATRAPSDSILVLSNVALFDGKGGDALAGIDIVIKGQLIQRIVKHGREKYPSGAALVDLSGDYAIPGLIDGHVHLTNRPEIGLELMLRAGITAVRDMGGDGAYLRQIQTAVGRGEILGPDIYFSAVVGGSDLILKDDRAKMSTPMEYELGAAPWMRIVDNRSNIPRVVADAISCGATGIKIYSHVSSDVAEQICLEAHRHGIKVWAHSFVYPARPEDVIAAGTDVISHADGLLYGPDWVPGRGSGLDASEARSERLAHILEAMQAGGTMLDPTVLVSDERLARDDNEANSSKRAALYEVVGLAHAKGVALVAGTDWPPPKSDKDTPALYEELRMLVDKAGLTPREAITAATRNNALALGIEASYGTIEPGKVAHIVVLEKDPTADITSISKINLVIKNGQPLAPQSKGEPR